MNDAILNTEEVIAARAAFSKAQAEERFRTDEATQVSDRQIELERLRIKQQGIIEAAEHNLDTVATRCALMKAGEIPEIATVRLSDARKKLADTEAMLRGLKNYQSKKNEAPVSWWSPVDRSRQIYFKAIFDVLQRKLQEIAYGDMLLAYAALCELRQEDVGFERMAQFIFSPPDRSEFISAKDKIGLPK